MVSRKAKDLIGSEIIRLAGDINEKIRQGHHIYNFTVGDFDPVLFPIPEGLERRILEAYQEGFTNYPPADGIGELKNALLAFLKDKGHLVYAPDEIMVAGGGRPLIYAIFNTIVDPGDKVVYPVPSWNNNHYTYLTGGQGVEIQTLPENNFMPTAEELAPHLKDAALLALCSPLNPTGTVFGKEQLEKICRLVLEENRRRTAGEKPLYLLYDQIYWLLTMEGVTHYDPVSLFPELKPYTIYVDGISKGFAATGVRIGWSMGPAHLISKMKNILGHVGAWAPRAEQHALAGFLNSRAEVDAYLEDIRHRISARLRAFYHGFRQLKDEGYPVDVITPQAAIYLTVNIDLRGKTTPAGKILQNVEDVTAFLLQEASLAIVPFYAFGKDRDACWFRLSIGTAETEEIPRVLEQLKNALKKLT